VTVTCPPVATLASVLVRCNADVGGRNQKSVSGGTQEVEEYFTGGLIPSTPCVSLECAIQCHSMGAGAQHFRNGRAF
jgi:hypothetical protein